MAASRLIRRPPPPVVVVVVTSILPETGWPGSLLAIEGSGFDEERDGNEVTVDGVPAIVVDASPTRLAVVVGAGTQKGPVRVSVAGASATAPRPFTTADWPDPGESGADGPPRFFAGPQRGTPGTNVANQNVLVIFGFPTDQPLATPADAQVQRATEMAKFGAANQWWKEVSYDSTSWNFTFTDWLALPRDRRFYAWEEGDITDARRWLLRTVGSRAAVGGTRAYAAHLGSALAIVDATTPTDLTELSHAGLSDKATGVRVVGQYAYVTAGQAGLYVVDTAISPPVLPGLPWSEPAVVTQVPTSAWLHGLDVTGNLLVVAAGELGIAVYDIGNATNPVQVGVLGFGANALATALRVVGARVFVTVSTVSPSGTAATLRFVDLTTPAAPTQTASIPIAASGTSVDVDGNVCGIATDGAGVQFFDVGGAAPVLSAAVKSPASTYGIDIRGTTAFVAAGGDGLRILDVANPTAPVEIGGLTVGAAYDVVTDGAGVAYLCVQGRDLVAVDVSTPSAPARLDGIELESDVSPAPSGPDIQWRRALIDVARDNQGFAKRHAALMLHAIRAAQGAGFDPNAFEGIIVVLNGPFLRGQSWLGNGFEFDGDSIEFTAKQGAIYVATNAEVARIAHEIGHWLGMLDLYEERFADGSAVLGTAAPWDLGGGGGDGLHLFSGFHISGVMGFLASVPPNVNVVERTWSLGAPATDETFDFTPHGAVPDVDPAFINVLRLRVAEGLDFYVELRRREPAAGGLSFDRTIPVASVGDARIVITRASASRTFANSRERQIMLLDALAVGESWADAARRIEISVESVVQTSPLVLRVRLRWNQPDVSDPTGKYDPWITPWLPGRWETVDIWVDSPRNGYGVFETFAPGKPSEPAMNGDRPWVGRINRIGARIRNSGVADATNLQVSFYVNSPPGIGDNGSWFTLGTKTIPTIPANGTALVSHDWVPQVGQHSCLRVEIMPKQNSEINVGNNMAQENVFTFDSAGASSHQPVLVETAVRSPFSVWKRVDLLVDGLPDGWHAVVDRAWVWLPPKGTRMVRAVIWTDLNTPRAGDRQIPPLAEVSIAAWTDFNHPYLPIGGLLARVKATKRVRLDCHVQAREGVLDVHGCLTPPLAGVPITVEVTDPTGARRYLHLTTDEVGCFDMRPTARRPSRIQLDPGRHTVQLFVTAGGEAAEAECEPVVVDVA